MMDCERPKQTKRLFGTMEYVEHARRLNKPETNNPMFTGDDGRLRVRCAGSRGAWRYASTSEIATMPRPATVWRVTGYRGE
jgi:hypothetical protein